jgi:hypothetical protein
MMEEASMASTKVQEIIVRGYKFAHIQVGAHRQLHVYFYATDPLRRHMAQYAFFEDIPHTVEIEMDNVMVPGTLSHKPLPHQVTIYGEEDRTSAGGKTFWFAHPSSFSDLVKSTSGFSSKGDITLVQQGPVTVDRESSGYQEERSSFQARAGIPGGYFFDLAFIGFYPRDLAKTPVRGKFGTWREGPFDRKALKQMDDWLAPFSSPRIPI